MQVFAYMEEWRTICNFESYQVSNYGNVRSNKYSKIRLLKKESVKGYLRVTLSKHNIQERFLIHRLVAIYFIENPKQKLCVNHIDGNGLNNNVCNLEWCTHSENERHSYDILGKINPIRKLNNTQVLDIRLNCKKAINHNNRGNVLDFMVKYNVDRKTILNILNKKTYNGAT